MNKDTEMNENEASSLTNLLSILEDRLDWNLIFIAATWIFLLATFFMIFF